MIENTYSLAGLEAVVGIPMRTIRSYIEKGLMPQPLGAGRAAHYDNDHLLRLVAIKVLRDQEGRSLGDIRRLLAGRPPSALLEYVNRLMSSEPDRAPELRRIFPEIEADAKRPETALEYVRRIQAHRTHPDALPAGLREPKGFSSDHGDQEGELPGLMPTRLAPESGFAEDLSFEPSHRAEGSQMGLHETSRARPMRRVGENALSRDARRRVRVEPVLRIVVTPDVDLIVRGFYQQDEIDRIEQAAEQLRRTLTSGRNDD